MPIEFKFCRSDAQSSSWKLTLGVLYIETSFKCCIYHSSGNKNLPIDVQETS